MDGKDVVQWSEGDFMPSTSSIPPGGPSRDQEPSVPSLQGRIANFPTLRYVQNLWQFFTNPCTTEEYNVRNVVIDSIGVGLASGIGTFLSVFLVRLGASNFLVSLLTSMPALTGILLTLFIGRRLEMARNLVPWFSRARLWVLLTYVLTGLVPFVTIEHAPEVIIAVWALATLPQTVTAVTFTIVMGAIVPPQRRFYLMSRRWTILGATSAITVVIVGQVLGWIVFPLNYQVIFLGSFVGGLISYIFSSSLIIPDSPPKPPMPRDKQPLGKRLQNWGKVLQSSKDFTTFTSSQMLFRLGLALPLPLFPIFWVRNLQTPDNWIGLINSAQTGVLMIAYFFWARVSRRRGNRFVLLVCAAGVALYPALTALMSRYEPLVLLASIAGIFQAGVDLVFFDLVLSTCPDDHRPTYISIYQTTVHVTSLVGPMMGVLIANIFSIQAAFILAAMLRLAGFAVFYFLKIGARTEYQES
ncbi:MAG: MFS transporter [Chloroflexi bacterium]|nr:MFS transporter [Chloroflexota bacterium]